MFDFLLDALDWIVSAVTDAISTAIGGLIGKFLYSIVTALLKVVSIIYGFFDVFSGGSTIRYDSEDTYMINIFFGNRQINQIYWGMALIGFIIIFVVTIVAVIKKSFDIEGKEQRSMGIILLDAGKSSLTILLISFAMTAVLNLTNVLINRVNYIFNNAGHLDQLISMKFSDEQFAAMARIYNTIGNYSLNDSYNSRYNLNSCYNEVREDLIYLEDQLVFEFDYNKIDGNNWQGMLAKLEKSWDPHYEHSIEYYDATSSVLLEIMDTLRKDKSFYPLREIKNEEYSEIAESVSVDRILFLIGTMSSAKNSRYNTNPSLSDALRKPYMTGTRSIYSYSQVSDDFNTSMTGIDYILIALAGFFTMKNLFICLFNAITRMFNLVGLYIIGPPVAGISPLDNGSMFKQWVQATVVQMFSIFGTIIPMRLVLMFLPIVLDSKLELFPSSITISTMAKIVFVVASMEASTRFSEVINGILAGHGGGASMRNSDAAASVGSAIGGVAAGGAMLAGGAAKAVAGGVGTALGHTYLGAKATQGAKAVGKWAGQKMDNFKQYAEFAKQNKGLLFSRGDAWQKYKKDMKKEKEEKEIKTARMQRIKDTQLERSEQQLGLKKMNHSEAQRYMRTHGHDTKKSDEED